MRICSRCLRMCSLRVFSSLGLSATGRVCWSQRKVLYYRNPMGLADTSPTPKKDPMGMGYVPVYEGEDEPKESGSPNQIRIGTKKIQKLGVRVEAASMSQLGRSVRAAAASSLTSDASRAYCPISPCS